MISYDLVGLVLLTPYLLLAAPFCGKFGILNQNHGFQHWNYLNVNYILNLKSLLKGESGVSLRIGLERRTR